MVWCGTQAVVSCFDSGSYRNIIQEQMLAQIEAESPGALVCRRACQPTKREGFASGGSVTYSVVAVVRVKFRDSPTKEVEQMIAFVVIPGATLPMILGCPTLDKLGAWWTKEEI